MRKIKTLGFVVLILALVMLVTPITAMIVTAPKYGPALEELPAGYYTYVEYERATEDELNIYRDEYGLKPIYVEAGDFYEKRPQPHEPDADNGVIIFELTNDSEAKKMYEVFYEKWHLSDYNPIVIGIGDEGVICYQNMILFRTGRFLVWVRMDSLCVDVARITEQNIKIATAPPTPTPTPTPTSTPQLEKDSDSDGVPDEYDYAPYDPNVQTKSDVKSPGFGAIFAIAGLLTVVYLLRRRE